MKQIKGVICAALCIALVIRTGKMIHAAPAIAVPKSIVVSVDGKRTTMNAYNIGGSNYFKLRDLAMLLTGTSKQFDVYWNQAASKIELISGRPYTVTQSDNAPNSPGDKTTSVGNQRIFLDSQQYSITAATISDLNYFKIRDFAAVINVPIDYDKGTDTILLSTGESPNNTQYAAKDYGFGQIGSFQTKDIKGQTVTNEIFKEKTVTFINYWATWCGPCRNELPDFQAMYDKYKDKVKFVTIIDDGNEAKSAAESLINSYLKSYVNLLPETNLLKPLRSGAVPTSVIVDSGGYLILDKIVGAYGRYDSFLDNALNKVTQ